MKTVRKVFCTDTPRRRHFLTDDLLSVIAPGKALALGTVWTGELRPLVDATLEAMAPIVSGFTSGKVLHAEPSTAALDLGRRYLGQLRDRVLDAAQRYCATGKDDDPNAVNLAPVAAGMRDLGEALVSGDVTSLARATDGLRRARDFLDSTSALGTRDAADWLTASDAHSRQAATAINTANRDFWKGRAPTVQSGDAFRAPATGVSPKVTEVRNQLHAANKATSMPGKIDALNAANRAFWSQR